MLAGKAVTFIVILFGKYSVVFYLQMFVFDNYVSLTYIHFSVGNRVATLVWERVVNSVCHLFFLWLYLSVCLFDLGLTSLSTIFQSYRNGVWL